MAGRSISFISGLFGYDIRFSGPIFDLRARRAMREYVDEVEQEIADEGVQMIRRELDRVLQHPTGYYRSQIAADRVSGDVHIHDSGVVYGPWLEGVGSRNFPETRFRGYHTFRRTLPKINRRAVVIAERLLRTRYLRRLQ